MQNADKTVFSEGKNVGRRGHDEKLCNPPQFRHAQPKSQGPFPDADTTISCCRSPVSKNDDMASRRVGFRLRNSSNA